MNLHNIVRGPIQAVTKDVEATLYVMSGKQQVQPRGDKLPVYYPGVAVKIQVQSLSSDAIQHLESIEIATTVRRMYLYATDDLKSRPWAAWRPLGRTGDYVQDDKGVWYRVDAVLEDFSREGWVSLQATMMTTPVSLILEDDEGGADGNP